MHTGKYMTAICSLSLLVATFSSSENLNLCGGVLYTPTGTIRPPHIVGYSLYDMNVDCLWTIVATQNEVIRFKIDNYHIEDSSDCRNDALLVRKLMPLYVYFSLKNFRHFP